VARRARDEEDQETGAHAGVRSNHRAADIAPLSPALRVRVVEKLTTTGPCDHVRERSKTVVLAAREPL